jgi:hypothetical protein
MKPRLRHYPGIIYRRLREAVGWRLVAYKDGWAYYEHGVTRRRKVETTGSPTRPPDPALLKRPNA